MPITQAHLGAAGCPFNRLTSILQKLLQLQYVFAVHIRNIFISNAHWKQQADKLNISKFSCASHKPWNRLNHEVLCPFLIRPNLRGFSSGTAPQLNATQKVHHFHVEITTDSRVLTALHHPSCSRFEMNLQPGDTLPWKFPADFFARKVSFFSQQRTRRPPQKKKREHHKQQKNYQKLVFGVNKPFPTRTNVHSQCWRLFRNTNGWSCRTWLWIGRCCSPTRLDVEAKNFSKFRAWNSFGMLLIV